MQIIFETKTASSLDEVKAAIKASRHQQSEALGANDHSGAFAASKEEPAFTQKLCIYELLSLTDGVAVWKYVGERDDFNKKGLRPEFSTEEAWLEAKIISAGSPLGSFMGSNALKEYDAKKENLVFAGEVGQRMFKEVVAPLALVVGAMWLVGKLLDRKSV